MASTDAEPFGKSFDPAVLKSALGDKAQRSGNGTRSSQPRRGAGRTLGTAPKTRTKAGLCSCGSGGEVTDVTLFACARRANRTAIDPRGKDSDEKLSIKSRVTRQPCAGAYLPFQIHVASIQREQTNTPHLKNNRPPLRLWTFSDGDETCRLGSIEVRKRPATT